LIFKTFNSDIDKISSKIGVLGKSFAEIRKTSKSFTTNWESDDSLWNTFFLKREDIQTRLIDVDKFTPKLNDTNAQKYLDTIFDIDKKVQAGTTTWQEYYDSLDEGLRYIAEYGQATQGQIRTVQGLQQVNKEHVSFIVQKNLKKKLMKQMENTKNLNLNWRL